MVTKKNCERDKPCNVLLHVCDLLLFPVILLHLRLHLLPPGLHELVVVSSIDLQLSQIHVHDLCAHAVQEVLEFRIKVYILH